jgi:NitT/TauT family transport system permease protein
MTNPRKSKRPPHWFQFRASPPNATVVLLGIAIWSIFFAIWEAASLGGMVSDLLMPSPHHVLATLINLLSRTDFLWDITASVTRILVSFLAACLIAVPLGIAMGAFGTMEAFWNPFVAAWRYLPAPAFIPVLLMWFGTGEGPKLALLFIGVVFFLITLVMDYTKQVRGEFIETAMTLGASRWQILWTVVVPAVLPNVVVAMRQMLAVSWTYLVIAEIVASTDGIGAMMMRARRFLHTDEILAGVIVIGALGLMFDMLFRWFHRLMFPYIGEQPR